MAASATEMTAAANSTQMPWSFKNFFKAKPPANHAKKWTPNCSSIRLSRSTGRPMTLK